MGLFCSLLSRRLFSNSDLTLPLSFFFCSCLSCCADVRNVVNSVQTLVEYVLGRHRHTKKWRFIGKIPWGPAWTPSHICRNTPRTQNETALFFFFRPHKDPRPQTDRISFRFFNAPSSAPPYRMW